MRMAQISSKKYSIKIQKWMHFKHWKQHSRSS